MLPRHAIVWGSQAGPKGKGTPLRLEAEVGGHQKAEGDVAFRMDRGLGLLDNVVVDVHLIERGRHPRLAHALSVSPEAGAGILGIGLDANAAAILLPDGTAETLGSGTVTLMRPAGPLREAGPDTVAMERLVPGTGFRWQLHQVGSASGQPSN